jgi:hypothetical protein
LKTCRETGVPASLERSRSGNGGHVWTVIELGRRRYCKLTK